MAREIAEIQETIIEKVQADSDLSAKLTSTSKRSIWRLWTFIVAGAIGFFEQLLDSYKEDIEALVAVNPPQTPAWFQDRVFKFQYSATLPQILQLIDLVPNYPVVDASLRIITRASVKTALNSSVTIKVAKGNPPTALSAPELAALQSYCNILGIAGITYNVLSTPADKLRIDADIYYNGAYAAVISDNVNTAINNFLSSLPFDGSMKVNDLELAIRNALGVNDVVLKNVYARADASLVSEGTGLVVSNQLVGRIWPTVAGYVVAETESGYTYAETLQFIAE